MNTTSLISSIKSDFESARNPNHTIQMENYMRNNFTFLEIQSPERKSIQ